MRGQVEKMKFKQIIQYDWEYQGETITQRETLSDDTTPAE